MRRLTLKDNPFLKEIVKRGFRSYRKYDVFLSVDDVPVTLSGAYWDGGTKSEWYSLTPDGVAQRYAGGHPGFGGPPERRIELNQGFAVVDWGIFCGKAATMHIHIGTKDAAKFGAAEPEPESDREMLVRLSGVKPGENGSALPGMRVGDVLT